MIVSVGNFHANLEGRNLNLRNGILRIILENSTSNGTHIIQKKDCYIGLQVIWR